jgi:hypothetical protein
MQPEQFQEVNTALFAYRTAWQDAAAAGCIVVSRMSAWVGTPTSGEHLDSRRYESKAPGR